MRLSEHERTLIKGVIRRHFGVDAGVRLFGSRTNDRAKGGDIDLLIELPQAQDHLFRATLAAEIDIQTALDDPKVDILVITPETQLQAIHEIALATGVSL